MLRPLPQTSRFEIQIHRGPCSALETQLASQYCRGCTNSLGAAVAGKDDSPADLASWATSPHSLVLQDTNTSNAKLACGEIINGTLSGEAK